MQTSTGYIQRIKQLRRDGYSYQKIADQTGVSIKTAHKWGKTEQVRGEVIGKTRQVKPPPTQSFTPSLTPDESLSLTPGKVKVNVGGKSKSLPTWGGIILVIMIIGLALLVFWIRNTPDVLESKDNPEPKDKKIFGFEGRTWEDLDEKKGLEDENYQGCC